MYLTYSLAIALLGIYPEKYFCQHKNMHIHVQGSFSIIAKHCKQPTGPSMGEQLDDLGHIHSMDYYSGIKRNKLSIHTAWMYRKGVMLSEGGQHQKVTYYTIP